MSFIYCRSCSWGQDDFWSKDGYNPFNSSSISWLTDLLFRDEPMAMDYEWIKDAGLSYKTHEVTEEAPEGGWKLLSSSNEDPYAPRTYLQYSVIPKDMLVYELQRKIRSIQNMKWKTYEDFKNDPDPRCPKCGESNWSID